LDAVDIVTPSVGEEFGGFFILTSYRETRQQKKGYCPEDKAINGSVCGKKKNCIKYGILKSGHGVMTGKCVPNGSIKTCEVYAWCPIQKREE